MHILRITLLITHIILQFTRKIHNIHISTVFTFKLECLTINGKPFSFSRRCFVHFFSTIDVNKQVLKEF